LADEFGDTSEFPLFDSEKAAETSERKRQLDGKRCALRAEIDSRNDPQGTNNKTTSDLASRARQGDCSTMARSGRTNREKLASSNRQLSTYEIGPLKQTNKQTESVPYLSDHAHSSVRTRQHIQLSTYLIKHRVNILSLLQMCDSPDFSVDEERQSLASIRMTRERERTS
jgi:hypothetical protein